MFFLGSTFHWAVNIAVDEQSVFLARKKTKVVIKRFKQNSNEKIQYYFLYRTRIGIDSMW